VEHTVMNLKMGRFGDIFSGYFVQACAKHLKQNVRVGTPVVEHVRNTHDYFKDLASELPAIRLLEDLVIWLKTLELEGASYADAYDSLQENLELSVDSFEGPIWDAAARAYIHSMVFSMRSWTRAIELLS
jgi:hypothetical protein